MKNQIITMKGEPAKIVAEVAVSLDTRTVTFRICELLPSGIFVVTRADFLQGTFATIEDARLLFVALANHEMFPSFN